MSRICAGQFQHYYYGLRNSAGSPGQNNNLPGEPEANPRKVAQVMLPTLCHGDTMSSLWRLRLAFFCV